MQAEQAFAAGRFYEARRLADSVDDQHTDAARARYLQGYALYKLGDKKRAALMLERSLALKPLDQVAFMCGLVAFELGRWSAARRLLEPLVAAKKAPWAATAEELLGRTRTQEQAEARAEAQRRHAEAIQQGKAHLQAARYAAAARAIAQAEAAAPGHALNHYYRGYLAYKRGRRAEARRHLRRALAKDPRDPWSRYMLALSLEQDQPERRRLLTQLSAETQETDLRQAARLALRTPRPASASQLSLRCELGGGLDTSPGSSGFTVTDAFLKPPPPPDKPPPPTGPNPSTTTTTDTDADAAAMALRGVVELAYQRQFAQGHHGGLGARLFEQAYAVGGEDLEQTELAGSVYYSWRDTRLDLTVTYAYGLHLLGHAPLMSLHDLGLHGGVQLRPWLRLSAGVLLRYRDMHDASYDYLQALEPSGSLTLDLRWSPLTIRAGYHLLRSMASPAAVTLSERLNKQNELVTTTYRSEHTHWGHGPQLELELSLPWRLTLSASAWALWGSFDQPDQFVVGLDDAVIWQEQRRDVQLLAGVELRRALGRGLELVIGFSSVDNLSSLDGEDDTPVDRTYSRRQLLGSFRWRWSAP